MPVHGTFIDADGLPPGLPVHEIRWGPFHEAERRVMRGTQTGIENISGHNGVY